MKKVILTGALMLFLMSFMSKKEEILFSPECFEYADMATASRPCGFEDDIDEYNYWSQQYDDCENVTDNDEFQFPN